MKKDPTVQFDICGIGMTMVDLIQLVEAFPEDGGVTQSIETQLMGGGPVPTALCGAAKLGATTTVIDRIGDDWRGRLARDEYKNYGVDLEHFLLEEGKTTTFGSVIVRKADGERHVIFSPGDFTPLTADELPTATLRGTRFLHLNGRHWPACLEAARIVREAGGKVSFDGGANRYEDKFDELIDLTDIAIVADDFARQFSGSDEVADQLAALISKGVEIAGVTNGENGSWFATLDGEVFHQPAFTVESVTDTTGCGDTFHGSFLFALSRDWSIRESAMFASAAAACNATGLGGRGKLPSLGEVLEMVQTTAK